MIFGILILKVMKLSELEEIIDMSILNLKMKMKNGILILIYETRMINSFQVF
jgi:DNA-binding transcriptional regulator GbsR (MarR family)